jgi:site-specific DNA-methyltransferase (adenine-specific)
MPDTKSQKRSSKYNKDTEYTNTYTPVKSDYRDDNTYGDSGSASRYFYCAKASKKDRDEGLEEFAEKINCDRNEDCYSANVPFNRSANARKNTHPTVKPTELMQYLVRLVTPNNGTVLDPFNGSGSTGKAVMYENKERNKGYKYIGIELTEEYLPIAQARIEYVCNLKEEIKPQTTIFDYIGDSNE